MFHFHDCHTLTISSIGVQSSTCLNVYGIQFPTGRTNSLHAWFCQLCSQCLDSLEQCCFSALIRLVYSEEPLVNMQAMQYMAQLRLFRSFTAWKQLTVDILQHRQSAADLAAKHMHGLLQQSFSEWCAYIPLHASHDSVDPRGICMILYTVTSVTTHVIFVTGVVLPLFSDMVAAGMLCTVQLLCQVSSQDAWEII